MLEDSSLLVQKSQTYQYYLFFILEIGKKAKESLILHYFIIEDKSLNQTHPLDLQRWNSPTIMKNQAKPMEDMVPEKKRQLLSTLSILSDLESTMNGDPILSRNSR